MYRILLGGYALWSHGTISHTRNKCGALTDHNSKELIRHTKSAKFTPS